MSNFKPQTYLVVLTRGIGFSIGYYHEKNAASTTDPQGTRHSGKPTSNHQGFRAQEIRGLRVRRSSCQVEAINILLLIESSLLEIEEKVVFQRRV